MSVDDKANALAHLANRLAESILDEFGLDGVIIKLHLGVDAAAVGLTSVSRAPRKLDEIIVGQVHAMTRYSREEHGARETGGLVETVNAETGERVIAHHGAKDGASS